MMAFDDDSSLQGHSTRLYRPILTSESIQPLHLSVAQFLYSWPGHGPAVTVRTGRSPSSFGANRAERRDLGDAGLGPQVSFQTVSAGAVIVGSRIPRAVTAVITAPAVTAVTRRAFVTGSGGHGPP